MTEDKEEYDELISEGRPNIIYDERATNDPNEDDTDAMTGLSSCFHYVAAGNKTEDGLELAMRGRFCFCIKCCTCRPNVHPNCSYKNIVDEKWYDGSI